MNSKLKIGEVANRAGVNIQTLRYYERRGILEEPERTVSGYRQYPVETVELVRSIKRAQKLGFSLDEIEDLLRIRGGGRGACAAAQDIAAQKLKILREKIEHLEHVARTLEDLIRDCAPRQRAEECEVLSAIGGNV
jgi:Hg(II)-responsive transcriptional regulator